MDIGIIGTGEVGRTIARRAAAAGHDVAIASRRSPAELAPLARELGVAALTTEQVASRAIVLLAVRWNDAPAALDALPAWNGRILIDATNPFTSFPPPVLADLDGASSSVLLAVHAPGARVVKAFNSVTMQNFDKGPREGDARRLLLVSGDDADANRTVRALVESMGYAALELGNLEQGGLMQQAGGPLAGKDLLLAG